MAGTAELGLQLNPARLSGVQRAHSNIPGFASRHSNIPGFAFRQSVKVMSWLASEPELMPY